MRKFGERCKEDYIMRKDQTVQEVRATLDEQWDIEKACELMGNIIDALEKQAKREGTTIEGWSLLDRMAWITKEAFIIGFMQAFIQMG